MVKKPETAMIFAAGLGTRMLPLTEDTPKPMVEVCGKPIIDYRIDQLKEIGVKKIIINTFHLADKIKEHLSNVKDVEIIISHEDERLETGGGLVKALEYLGDEPFYVSNSDVILIDRNSNALERLAKTWDAEKMDMLFLMHPIERAIGYHGNGDFDLDKNGQIMVASSEKKPFVFTGMQILNPKVLEGYKAEPFSLSEIFMKAKNENGFLDRVYGIINEGDWLHIGTVEDIKVAENFLSCSIE